MLKRWIDLLAEAHQLVGVRRLAKRAIWGCAGIGGGRCRLAPFGVQSLQPVTDCLGKSGAASASQIGGDRGLPTWDEIG